MMFGANAMQYENAAKKIVKVFADEQLTVSEIQFVSFYVTHLAQPASILDKIREFGRMVEVHNERNMAYEQDTLF